ncbi:hypothetical protein PAHAL_9G294800 [Panicum hallii]|uniref:Uncharacterized protein n=1 Tax=Panicum hallii TaxID=206008 RepID=A0A2T8I2Y3_9POAL|nr:hypothetical protein PAHAL_9G294800 [Panicum hallii]
MRARADQKSSDFVCVESFVCEAVVVWSGLFVGVVAGIISPSIRGLGWLSDWTRARIFQFSLSFSSACGAHATRRIRALWLALISRLGFRRRESSPWRRRRWEAELRTDHLPASALGHAPQWGDDRFPSWAGTSERMRKLRQNPAPSRDHRWWRPRESDPGSGGFW